MILLLSKGKLVTYIVGHIPKELSRADWYFLERSGRRNGKVFEEKWPSPIPKYGLEIMLSAELRIAGECRKVLERFREVI